MLSPFPASLKSNRELSSLYRIAQIPQPQAPLQDYFHDVSAILSEYFSITYSALVLQEPQRESVRVEGVYGFGKETHPTTFSSRKGTIGKVLESRTPMPIQNVSQEPLFEEIEKGIKKLEKIRFVRG